MKFLRGLALTLSLFGIIAPLLLSPAAADAITGVEKFGSSEERFLATPTVPAPPVPVPDPALALDPAPAPAPAPVPAPAPAQRSLSTNLVEVLDASAFLLGKPGSSSVLSLVEAKCEITSELAMMPLDLKSSNQKWNYNVSTSSIQSVACPDMVITISDTCSSVAVSAKGDGNGDLQKFSFEEVVNLSDDETTGVKVTSTASSCTNKVLSNGGTDGSIGLTITMCQHWIAHSRHERALNGYFGG